ncbi:MAG: class I SAM-dependent rRNA methyltransferase [Bacillus subtilis]|nr:class I SAM-dependent rRNA methyltransferase [Bacillus subtilis]
MSVMQIHLKPKEELRLLAGHSWVYGNEIQRFDGDIVSGELAEVYSSKGEFIGKGYLNTASKIFVRILSRKQSQTIDPAFFAERIAAADVAKRDLGYRDSYRVVFGEADGIPGLIVDKYADYLVVQVLSLGIDQRKDWIVQALVDRFSSQRNFGTQRRRKSASKKALEAKGVLYGTIPDWVEIDEGGVKINVNLLSGQKTGYFLDQQSNHQAVAPYVKNKRVLDCFSHTGGFGIHAAHHGAKQVTFVELSQLACDQIKINCQKNKLENINIVKDDVFGLLRKYVAEDIKYDVVILDPPAFTKTADNLKKAYAGYKEINLQAMKIVADGGYLITCSCSHYMTPSLFLDMLVDASTDAGRNVQMVEFRTQGKDHPTLLGSEETLYLKCVVLRVADYR